MRRAVMVVLAFCVLGGCVQTKSSHSSSPFGGVYRDSQTALWGRVNESDGSEYFRVGKMLILVKHGKG